MDDSFLTWPSPEYNEVRWITDNDAIVSLFDEFFEYSLKYNARESLGTSDLSDDEAVAAVRKWVEAVELLICKAQNMSIECAVAMNYSDYIYHDEIFGKFDFGDLQGVLDYYNEECDYIDYVLNGESKESYIVLFDFDQLAAWHLIRRVLWLNRYELKFILYYEGPCLDLHIRRR